MDLSNDEFEAIINDQCRATNDQLRRMNSNQLQRYRDALHKFGDAVASGHLADTVDPHAAKNVASWKHEELEEAPSWNKAWRSSKLYTNYVVWCKINDIHPLSNVLWGAVLGDLGFPGIIKQGERKRRLCAKA